MGGPHSCFSVEEGCAQMIIQLDVPHINSRIIYNVLRCCVKVFWSRHVCSLLSSLKPAIGLSQRKWFSLGICCLCTVSQAWSLQIPYMLPCHYLELVSVQTWTFLYYLMCALKCGTCGLCCSSCQLWWTVDNDLVYTFDIFIGHLGARAFLVHNTSVPRKLSVQHTSWWCWCDKFWSVLDLYISIWLS
jgi:hypothetical protein